jgi:hypothetical protein
VEAPRENLRVNHMRAIAELDSGAFFEPLPGMHEGLPDLALWCHHLEPSHEQTLRRAASRQSPAKQTRWKHQSVVDDEQVSAPKQRRQIRELMIGEGAGGAVEDQQTRKPPPLRGLLRNQFGR